MRKFTFVFCLCLLVVSFGCAKARAASILIVEQGGAKAYIAVPAEATGQVKAAANNLARYIKRSTGAELAVRTGVKAAFANKMAIIRVETSPPRPDSRGPGLSDGFSINFPDARTILISGNTDWGTEFGVYEFLERYVGVKWLMPGADGEFIPRRQNIEVPVVGVRQEPAFFSRSLSGLKGREQLLWARHNRMHSQIRFHHNLFHLFPPAKYTTTHPEFFPIINGKRFLPPNGMNDKWQPCFSAPGIVAEAVKNICAFFAAHPQETTFSLGVNDSSGHCQCAQCRAKDSGKKNFVGLQDLSNRYYGWANAVVKEVLDKYPDKWFGCLAYSEVAAPPVGLKLNPHIVPFLTYDRLKWVSDSFAHEGREITESWQKAASHLGWYDYIYGTPYLAPRVYFHTMAEYLRWGHDHGVCALYAEAYPNWGEGPKLYLTLKLYWNPDLNVDEVLNDWYVAAVGAEAAPYLAAYYKLWEEFWTKRVPQSHWFNNYDQYLNFDLPDYLALVTAGDIIKARHLLLEVFAMARTEKEKKRAHLILRAFEYYEASMISYLGLVKKDHSYFKAMNERRLQLVNEFEQDPVLFQSFRPDKCGKLIWGNGDSPKKAMP